MIIALSVIAILGGVVMALLGLWFMLNVRDRITREYPKIPHWGSVFFQLGVLVALAGVCSLLFLGLRI